MTSNEIVWGVKTSFVRYVRAAGGAVELDGGAWIDDGDRFHFPVAATEKSDPDAVTATGSVHLTAYDGLLSLVIAAPRVARSGASAELSARLGGSSPRTVIAELRPSDSHSWEGQLRWIGVEARLTQEGADAIDPLRYFAGQRVDPLDLTRSTETLHYCPSDSPPFSLPNGEPQ